MVGLERERHRHPAGLRTMAMVSLGSALFTALGVIWGGHNVDPTRIAAQVVTGVGFLGAGAILRSSGAEAVKGLTTAATIWVVAAIGMAAGFGALLLAAGGTVLVLVGLVLFRPIEKRIFSEKSSEDIERDAGR